MPATSSDKKLIFLAAIFGLLPSIGFAFDCKDALLFDHIAPKGRVQDKEYNPGIPADSILANKDKCIPFLISNLENMEPKTGAIPYWKAVTVGDVSLWVLTSLFEKADWTSYTLKEMSWDSLLGSSGGLEERLRAFDRKHGRKALRKKVAGIWERNKNRIVYNKSGNCLDISK